MVGLVTIALGLLWGSRTLVTQEELNARLSEIREQKERAHSAIWKELDQRESKAFRQNDWDNARLWIQSEFRRLEEMINTNTRHNERQ